MLAMHAFQNSYTVFPSLQYANYHIKRVVIKEMQDTVSGEFGQKCVWYQGFELM